MNPSRGEAHYAHRLTTAAVADVLRRRAAGDRIVDIARDLGVDRALIGAIVARRSWKHVLPREFLGPIRPSTPKRARPPLQDAQALTLRDGDRPSPARWARPIDGARASAAADRFWGQVDRTASCWLWRGFRRPAGHGTFSLDGRAEFAHRVAYALIHDGLPRGVLVLHRCGTPACVNPEHLYLGTAADNVADTARHGRTAKGERISSRKRGSLNYAARLSEATVSNILARVHAGESQTVVARALGVVPSTINSICRGRSWRHVSRGGVEAPTVFDPARTPVGSEATAIELTRTDVARVSATFWTRALEDSSGCWLWTGPTRADGRARIYLGGHPRRWAYTSRVAFALVHGAVPRGALVLHTCDVMRCVRPEHLRLGTVAANARDARMRGRTASGPRNGQTTRAANAPRGSRVAGARLTEAAVVDMLAEFAGGAATVPALADRFGVRESTIRDVLDRKTWRHVRAAEFPAPLRRPMLHERSGVA